jgi:multidrug efflux pump subunit AcrA (membrane-fusion protein)
MSLSRRSVAAGIVGIGAAGVLVVLYRSHRGEISADEDRDRPVVAPSRIHQSGDTVFVSLDSADARRIGLETAALAGASRAADERMTGEVIPEPARTASLRAPVAGRLSVASGARWPSLGERVVAGRDLIQVSDARPMASPISGIVTSVSAQPGALVEAGQELLQVVDQSRPLLRVAWTDGGREPPRSLSVTPVGGSARVMAKIVGPSPEVDPVTRRAAYLYRADHAWPGAAPGSPILVHVPGKALESTSMKDVLVPDRAVVQWEGLAWVYLQRAALQFQRVRVPTDRPAAGGWLAGGNLAPGDTVVVAGAQELLSEEFRARVTVGDESGE